MDIDIAAIEKRAREATPGPWTVDTEIKTMVNTTGFDDAGEYGQIPIWHEAYTVEDAAFIAHARQDIPALLAERAELIEAIRQAHEAGRKVMKLCQIDLKEESFAPLTDDQRRRLEIFSLLEMPLLVLGNHVPRARGEKVEEGRTT